MHIEGTEWAYYEDADGTYIHFHKGESKVGISVGHPEDTLDDFVKALVEFIKREAESRVKPLPEGYAIGTSR